MTPPPFDPVRFQALCSTRSLGHPVEFLEHVSSTNDVAWERVAAGAPHGTLIVAGQQTRGRGRHGRAWLSPPGGLWCSLLLRPGKSGPLPPAAVGQLPLLAGVAVADALRRVTSLPVALKWPNDLWMADKKVGGILVETRGEGSGITVAVLGIGVNLHQKREAFPGGLPATSLLLETGNAVELEGCLAVILEALEEWLTRFEREGFDPVREAWKRWARHMGTRVRVECWSRVLIGETVDLDERGALVVRCTNGVVETVLAGDVALLRDAR